jgi:1-acylglycerone phosphate reductase
MKDLESLPNVHLLTLDVVSSDSVAAVAKQVEVKTGGRLDYLINNAGAQYAMPVLDLDLETAKGLFEVNYWGAVRMVQAFSYMLVAAKGTIVNVGSLAGLLNLPLQSK